MKINMEEKFKKLISCKKDPSDTILGILPRIPLSNHKNPRIKVSCHFIDYIDSEQRRTSYFSFIHESILTYVLERTKLKWIAHPSDFVRLNTEAKWKIWDIMKEENEKNDWLLGEWNLYLFLEYIENAKKLVSRMSLDTSTQWNRKGLDLVHFKINEDKIYLYLGESKIYKDVKTWLNDSLLSINKFYSNEAYKKEQINIISEHLDLSWDEELEEFLLKTKFFTPSATVTHNEILSIFIMFDSKSLADLEKKHSDDFKSREELIKDIENQYKDYFESTIYKELEDQLKSVNFKESWINRTEEEIEADKKMWITEPKKTKTQDVENKIKNKEFIFYFLPVKDVERLRIDFKKYLKDN